MNQPKERYNSDSWELHRAVTPKLIALFLLLTVLIGWSAHNTEMDRAALENIQAVGALIGIGDSKVVSGATGFIRKAFPFVVKSKTETERLDNFDPDKLPLFTHVENVTEREYDTLTDSYSEVDIQYLVHPFGYLIKVLVKMWETLEMAFWGTLFSIMISLPLGILSARNYTPNKAVYSGARGLLGFHRSMPELIIALFFVLMYGFGPIAGIFALAVHTSGVLGKFFADEIENAPTGPQDALRTSGAGKLKVLRFAVLPQVLPQYVAYVQYIFERNIRTATVLGIVGAGGIGMELKGRWDLFDYDHVSTILLIIFITVMLLELISQKLRARTM
ncbi:MAG: phosphonate ABC transporter, permease protein PhnE [Desulfobulbaceae bacterium]|uniref:Phosphonate ABC transporter, permease protein PhnE n=1 Tax=Candidatus Desulfobia pelagia TaxID=2841692 RepID=A0A8J6NGW5_9BACT|nr:phosphonate ABC transporter, permease protein PhnE [Candidatus Desulfobia pelagia]